MNPTRPTTGPRQPARPQWTFVLVVNVVAAVIPGAYGVLGLAVPGARPGISDPITDAVTQYASLYGTRSVAIALLLLVLLSTSWRTPRPSLIPVLALAGTIQLGDCVLIIATGDFGQLAGPAISTATHLATVGLLTRTARAPEATH